MPSLRRADGRSDIGYVEPLCPGAPRPAPKSSPGIQSVSSIPTSSSSPRPTSSGQPSFLTNFSPSPQPAYPPGSAPPPIQADTMSYTPTRFDPSRPATFAGHPTPLIQGFTPSNNFQRQPSTGSTSTNTTTTTTTAAGRPYSAAPIPNPTFPVPAPSAFTPLKQEPTSSPLMSSGSHDRSSDSHDSRSKRYSTATAATFGRWDQDLHNAMSPGGPVSYFEPKRRPSDPFAGHAYTSSTKPNAHPISSSLAPDPFDLYRAFSTSSTWTRSGLDECRAGKSQIIRRRPIPSNCFAVC